MKKVVHLVTSALLIALWVKLLWFIVSCATVILSSIALVEKEVIFRALEVEFGFAVIIWLLLVVNKITE